MHLFCFFSDIFPGLTLLARYFFPVDSSRGAPRSTVSIHTVPGTLQAAPRSSEVDFVRSSSVFLLDGYDFYRDRINACAQTVYQSSDQANWGEKRKIPLPGWFLLNFAWGRGCDIRFQTLGPTRVDGRDTSRAERSARLNFVRLKSFLFLYNRGSGCC